MKDTGTSAWAWPARRPRAALLVAAVVTVVAVGGSVRIGFESNLADLVPTKVRSAGALARFQRVFSDAEPVVALIEGEAPSAVEECANEIAEAAARSPWVRSATASLDLGRGERIRSAEVYRYLDDLGFRRARLALSPRSVDASVRRARSLLLSPGTGGLAESIREDPLSLRRLLAAAYRHLGPGIDVDPTSGRFVTEDGRAALVLVRPKGSPFDARLARSVSRDLERISARVGRHAGTRVRFTGPHVVARDTERMIRGDLARSAVLSLGAIVLVLLFAFGRIRAALLLALPLVVGSVWTAGFAGWVLAGFNAVSVAFAAIVLGLGDDASVHLLADVAARRRAGQGPRDATIRSLVELGPPAAAAAVTAAVAFAALGMSSFRALRELGLLAAVGVVSAFLVGWLVLGPILARAVRPVAVRAGLLENALERVGRFAAERRRLVLLVAAGVTLAAAVLGLPSFADRVVGVRPATLPALATQRDLFRRFGGTPGQWVALQDAGDLDQALARSDRLADALRELARRGLVAGFDSSSALHPSRRTQERRFERWRRLPLRAAADRLEKALAARGFATAQFEPALTALRSPAFRVVSPALDAEGAEALLARRHMGRDGPRHVVATYVRPARGVDPERLASSLRRLVPGASLTGYPLLEHEVRGLLPGDLGRAGAFALVLVLATLAVHFRRARPVVVSFVGLWVGAAGLLVALRIAGVRWTAYNLLVLPVLVGIAVDENVFFVTRYLASTGDRVARTSAAARRAGRAIATTAVTTMVGFGALVVCEFDGVRDFGLTAALGIGACLLSSLTVTPALAASLLGDGGATAAG